MEQAPSTTMETYYSTLETVGESILSWADPKNEFRGYTEGWPLTDAPTAFNIAFAYLGFVLIGSAVMKAGVPAMDPYYLKFVYNVSQIMLCAYMTIEAGLLAYRNGYTLVPPCNPYSRDNPPVANLLWLFYISKVWDFWDTIFIVVGKKWRQLSFLHVYHHTTIFLIYWFNANVDYDGDIYLTIVLNGFIHTVMYTYYFVCMHTKVPETGKSLPIWWKSSLTLLQLIQFVTMMSQGSYIYFSGCPSNSPRVAGMYVCYILSLFFLFLHFFINSYVKKPKKKTA